MPPAACMLFYHILVFGYAQIQVVEDGSTATSPETPEFVLAKILKQKGKTRPQLRLKFILKVASQSE